MSEIEPGSFEFYMSHHDIDLVKKHGCLGRYYQYVLEEHFETNPLTIEELIVHLNNAAMYINHINRFIEAKGYYKFRGIEDMWH